DQLNRPGAQTDQDDSKSKETSPPLRVLLPLSLSLSQFPPRANLFLLTGLLNPRQIVKPIRPAPALVSPRLLARRPSSGSPTPRRQWETPPATTPWSSSPASWTKNVHQGYPTETLVRFLKAREWHVNKAQKMLVESLNWRIQNEIDNILEKPIIPVDLYRSIRDTQLVGLSGYSKEGIPVFAVGVGLSTYDKASVNYYVQSHIQINEYRDRFILPMVTKKYGRPITTCIKVLDMTGLKLSALNQMKIVTAISTVDDLNYPEKTETYYIVNAPYIFSACWKVVKPLLQERTRKKVHVLRGCGKDELLKIMDYSSLPHFCRREGSGASKHSSNDPDDCFSLDHPFHQELYSFIQEQALNMELIKQGSMHVNIPEQDPEDAKIVGVIEAEFHKLTVQNGSTNGADKE
ncbi:unnamed protein product, partial [Urochloa humidicola]